MNYYVGSLFWTLIFSCLSITKAGIMGDECDWTGSGLSEGADRGVTPVYVRCREGRLTWLYPRGALRLTFRPRLPPGERDFRVCIRVVRRIDPPDVFPDQLHEPPGSVKIIDTGPVERFPARLFLEGAERLTPLYAPDDGDPREVRCFRSKKGKAALYVEAEPEIGTRRRVAELRYEARPLPIHHYDPAAADCRPCNNAELELAYCTSDLVSRGVIVGSEDRDDLDTTQLTLKLTKLIRLTGGDPTESTNHSIDGSQYFHYDMTSNEIDDKMKTHDIDPIIKSGRRKRKIYADLQAHVHVAQSCGASSGSGEFLVMARRRLGKLSLVCAPRIEDWIALADRMNADGNAHCLLKH